MSAFNADIFIGVQTANKRTVIIFRDLRADDIVLAIRYFLLSLAVSFLAFVQFCASWLDEPMAWIKIATEWTKVYLAVALAARHYGPSEKFVKAANIVSAFGLP